MFEEVFYLAAQHERLSKVTRLYCPPFQTLARVHDKGTFQELCDKLGLRTPRTVLAHSRQEVPEAIGRFPNVTVTEGAMGDGVYEAIVSTLAGA